MEPSGPSRPSDDLFGLIARGLPLVSRYVESAALADARNRFVVDADLRNLGTPTHSYQNRPPLPIAYTTSTGPPPKVAIVTPDIVGPIRNGGIGTAYTSLAKALAAHGHDVTILYTLGRHCENGDIGDWVAHYRKEAIRFAPLEEPDGPAVFHGPRASFAAYKWLVKNGEFEVVHFPEWGGSGFSSVKAKRLGLAFQKTLLCVGTHSPTLWHDLADRRTVDSLDQLARDFLERQSVECADVVVSPSQYLLRWIAEAGWSLPERSYVQPYVSPLPSRVSQVHQVSAIDELVFFGRLESRKGLELFCDAVDKIADAPSLEPATVTFLGKVGRVAGQDGLEYLRARASGWTRPWRAFVDKTQAEAVEYLVSRRALAVMPSLADNTPNTVLECLGAGIPFLASAVGGIPEMIAAEDRTRSLAAPDAAAFAQALTARLAHGAAPSQPAANPDDTRQRWIDWHEQAACQAREAVHPRSSTRPLVSVCIATRERPAFLEQAVESLRGQTYSPLEVVLVDDGSESEEAQRHLDELDREFGGRGWALLRRNRSYPGAARNAAAAHASGRYLLFMDDDNVSRPHEIETFVQAAESSGAAFLTCAHDAFEGESAPANAAEMVHRWMPIGPALPLSFFMNCIGDTNMLARREAFFQVGGFDEEPGAGLFEDWVLFAKAIVRGFQIEALPEVLYSYRLGPHGFGQRAHSFESYVRPLRPYLDLLPPGIGQALLYAVGSSRRNPVRGESVEPSVSFPETSLRRLRPRDRMHTWLVDRLGADTPIAEEGEHLRSRFALSQPVDVIGPSDASRLDAHHQVEISSGPDGIGLQSIGDEPQLLLRPSKRRGRGPFLIRLEMTARTETNAQFYWKTPMLPVYCEPQSVCTKIDTGRNVRFVSIPAARLVGAIRFDPADIPGGLVLHTIEIRSEYGNSRG
jgi:glycosyltransferase involved in cell wall biosynthesis/GT2 family glycosyltransferase